MAEAGDYMLQNRADVSRMGAAARAWTLDLMNPEKLIGEQREIFMGLMKASNR
jgi:hypothetical protein